MSLTEKEVSKIANLSKIEVSADKKTELANKIGKILNWMDNLNEVDTANVEPISNVHQINLPMSKDVVGDGGMAEEVLKNAPDAKYNYFTVPKMI